MGRSQPPSARRHPPPGPGPRTGCRPDPAPWSRPPATGRPGTAGSPAPVARPTGRHPATGRPAHHPPPGERECRSVPAAPWHPAVPARPAPSAQARRTEAQRRCARRRHGPERPHPGITHRRTPWRHGSRTSSLWLRPSASGAVRDQGRASGLAWYAPILPTSTRHDQATAPCASRSPTTSTDPARCPASPRAWARAGRYRAGRYRAGSVTVVTGCAGA